MDLRESEKTFKKLSIGIPLPSNPEGGGIFQYSQSFVEAIISVKDEFPVEVYVFYDKNYSDIKKWITKNFSKEKQEFFKDFSYPRSIDRKFLKLISLILKKPIFSKRLFPATNMFGNIDLFLVPFIGAAPHFFINKPFIFTLHDLQERYYPQFFTLKERFLRRVVNRALVSKAMHILCESKYVKLDIIKFLKVHPEKISVIPAPPPKLFKENLLKPEMLEKVRIKYNLPKKYIFYPAQFWYHKNHLKLLEAFKIINYKFPDIYLVFTGASQNNYENVVKKIKDLDLLNKVRLLGYVNYDDLPYIYKLALFLVMPSLFESISIPIYEAFSLGIPVCASNVCGIPEQVGEAGLLFDPKDVNDMAEKMEIMLKDIKLREKLISVGKERLKNLDHKFFGRKILNLVLKLFKEHLSKNEKTSHRDTEF